MQEVHCSDQIDPHKGEALQPRERFHPEARLPRKACSHLPDQRSIEISPLPSCVTLNRSDRAQRACWGVGRS